MAKKITQKRNCMFEDQVMRKEIFVFTFSLII